MRGSYGGTGGALQERIAPLVTEQSSGCPLYKQTGKSDQYGYQTRPTVVCVWTRQWQTEGHSAKRKSLTVIKLSALRLETVLT